MLLSFFSIRYECKFKDCKQRTIRLWVQQSVFSLLKMLGALLKRLAVST